MAVQNVNASVPNCQIIVWDAAEGDYPAFGLELVRSTGSAIVVSCIPWSEGQIALTIGRMATSIRKWFPHGRAPSPLPAVWYAW